MTIPSESGEVEARDRAQTVEPRVGLPVGGRGTLVVGDTDGKEPSLDFTNPPFADFSATPPSAGTGLPESERGAAAVTPGGAPTGFEFVVPGAPLGWARAGGGKSVMRFTPAPQRHYMGALKLCCAAAMKGAPPLDGPIAVDIHAVYPWPASWSMRKRALPASRWKISTPDYDNLAKLVGDALNTIAWADDSRICSANVRKFYGDAACLRVRVRKLG